MSKHSSHHSGNNSSSSKNLFKQISKDLQSLQLWRLQEEKRRDEEKHEIYSHLAVLEEELRMLKEKYDMINEKFKKSHFHRSSSQVTPL